MRGDCRVWGVSVFGCLSFTVFCNTKKIDKIIEISRSMNPRMVWCYMGEDMMGKVRVLAMASAKGQKPWQVTEKTMIRYLYGLDCLFECPEKWLRAIAK